MIVEEEVIAPGTYWYLDMETGAPRKLDVKPEDTRYWHDQGAKMLSSGLTVPVPCEHDFNAHPMTPKEKLLNNAGWVKGYKLKDIDDPVRGKIKDVLFSEVEVLDPEIIKKLPRTIRWTSPWFNSFTDGAGKRWDNVISHLALTTRPRIAQQQPFPSIAAALSLAQPRQDGGKGGYTLTRAGLLLGGRPAYPMAFSLVSGAALGPDDLPPKKGKKPGAPAPKAPPEGEPEEPDEAALEEEEGAEPEPTDDLSGGPGAMTDPLGDSPGDVMMEEILCDLLQALGVPMPNESNENEFKRHLYEAAMSKIKELTSKGMGKEGHDAPDQNKPPSQQPNASKPMPNPLIGQVQQEAQPMYMSVEEINQLPDPLRGVALAMFNENQKIRAEMEAAKKVSDGLREAELKKAMRAREQRVAILKKLTPDAAADLDAMCAMESMVLSMDAAGNVVDPMANTLKIMEKAVGQLPTLLRTEQSALSISPQPTDESEMSDERSTAIADGFSRMMGAAAG